MREGYVEKVSKEGSPCEYQSVDKGHFTVLQQTEIVGSYFEKHLRMLRENNKVYSDECIVCEQNLDLPNSDTMEEKMLKM